MSKWILILAICLLLAGIAAADGGNETDADNTIPAVSFTKILDEAAKLVAGWFKQIIGLMILAGGIYYIFGRSEEARASGVSHLKRPVEALLAVIGLTWFVNFLFTL